MQRYPAQHIREKLATAQGLVASGSCLVSQNPAGWLRRAIEEDYSPPRTTERQHQRAVREKRDVRVVRAEPKNQHLPKEEPKPTQTVPTEKKEPELTSRADSDSARENETAWNKALEKLKAGLPVEEVDARLTGTTLIEVTDTKAMIFVPNRFAIPWLERRLYGQIAKAMKGVLGKDLDLQFIAAS
jgi:hypothetical protein